MKIRGLANLNRWRRMIEHFYLSEAAKLILGGVIMAGALTLALPEYQILTSLICILLLGSLVGVIVRPKIRVTGQLPDKIIAGKEVMVRYQLTNESHFPAYEVALGFTELPRAMQMAGPDRCLFSLKAGQTKPFDIHFTVLRRGVYEILEPCAYSTFPFNLYRNRLRGQRRQSKPVLVLPDYHPLQQMEVAVDPRYQPGGIVLASKVGESPEYIGNRPFLAGDSPRKIDTRAWARLAIPVVKEYHEEYYCHVAVVLDTHIAKSRIPKRSGYPNFEAAVSLTASIADFLSRDERIIDFFAAGPDLYVFRSGRHTAHFENLLDILASVGHCYSNPFEVITPALEEELTRTSSVVFVLLDWDEYREKLLRLAVNGGCHVRVFIVRDRPVSKSFAEAQGWAGQFQVFASETIRQGRVERL